MRPILLDGLLGPFGVARTSRDDVFSRPKPTGGETLESYILTSRTHDCPRPGRLAVGSRDAMSEFDAVVDPAMPGSWL
jgi:hypothetical protein